MNKPATKPNFSRLPINLLVILLLGGGLLFSLQRVAVMQVGESAETEKPKPNAAENKSPAIHKNETGRPFINFRDGFDLSIPAGLAAASSAPPKTLAAADFDSDGIEDLVTADTAGLLRFYRGTGAARRPEAAAAETVAAEPFVMTARTFELGFAPDFLEAGDFNADGRPDLLAAAAGASSFVLLGGDGTGRFAPPRAIAFDGRLTALAAGEIGRSDGQTDLAVAYADKSGAFLAVFEHPEGAFARRPEIYKLPAAATDLAIGNLDGDFYADVAAACGNDLTVVAGRGQAYPWDLMPASGIKRPRAVTATRRLPFAIAALAAGRFGGKRGESLALLGGDGNLYRLAAADRPAPANPLPPDELRARARPNPYLPADVDGGNLALLAPGNGGAERLGLPLFDADELRGGRLDEVLRKKQEAAAAQRRPPDKAEIDRLTAAGRQKKAEFSEKTKRAFLRSLAARPSTLAAWPLATLAAGSPLAAAAAANAPVRLRRVNVSDSATDDLLALDSNGRRIQLISRVSAEKDGARVEIAALETEGRPLAVLPLRLNLDALSDLVVLREGAAAPAVALSAPANVYVVTSTDDTGDCLGANPCSLRNAILLANDSPGVDTIVFNLGGGPQTITPSAPLPVITNPVSMQGGSAPNNAKLVEISGANVPAPADGLKVRTSHAFIYNLAINRFAGLVDGNSVVGGNAVTIETPVGFPTSASNTIYNNYLGTDPTGSFAAANAAAGLNIFDGDSNSVYGNVISGNTVNFRGVGIVNTGGELNSIQANIIGLNAAGTAKLPNGVGILMGGGGNLIGGDGPNQGNTISGNGKPFNQYQCGGNGLSIATVVDLSTGALVSLDNDVRGNRIGTDPGGTQPLGNCSAGIATEPVQQTTIGSIVEGGRNVIADNGFQALYCDDESITTEGGFCAVAGNNIGTDVTGSVALPNDFRNQPSGFDRQRGLVDFFFGFSFSYFGAPGGTTPGGPCTGFCNLYAGNGGSESIYYSGRGTMGFFNNYIGTNRAGTQALPNWDGIEIGNVLYGETYVGGVGRDENGATASLGNLISGNGGPGITAFTFDGNFPGAGYSSPLYITGNRIGTDATGTFAVPNGANPDFAYAPSGIQTARGYTEPVDIGGPDPLDRNIVSGNAGNGIVAQPTTASPYPSLPLPVRIANNLIGLNASLAPLGNGYNGIVIPYGFGAQIGGTDQEANQIVANGTQLPVGAGILIKGVNGQAQSGRGITVRNNLIRDNAGLGIDLGITPSTFFYGGDGVTANDCQDTDLGANDAQNYPEMIAPVQNNDGTVTVAGILRSLPNRSYILDFYSNETADPTEHGEGAVPIGTLTVATNGSGFTDFAFTSAGPVAASLAITATATDDLGSTSEFSCAAGQCLAPGVKTVADLMGGEVSTCIVPIIVTETTDAADTDGDQPNNGLRDGRCDTDPDRDGEQCSLRAAIQEANARPGPDFIEFAIPGAGVQTIAPAAALPEITGIVFLRGLTQPGSASGAPLIKLDGSQTTGSYGLKVSGESSTIDGLAIVGFQKGIGLSRQNQLTGRNRVTDCLIGVNADGLTAPSARMEIGIEILGGGDNVIERSVVSNNLTGILIAGSFQNQLLGNYIGTDRNGTKPLPNDVGVILDGGSSNRVGVDIGSPNVISANNQAGVVIRNDAFSNQVAGNFIGPAMPGTEEINEGVGDFQPIGVKLETGARINLIGSIDPDKRNVISGNRGPAPSAGVFVADTASTGNRVLGNYVGTGIGLQGQLPNKIGIFVAAAQTVVGTVGAPNYATSNMDANIQIAVPGGGSLAGTTVTGNRIGYKTVEGATLIVTSNGLELRGDGTGVAIKGNTITRNDCGVRIEGRAFTVGSDAAADANTIYENGTGYGVCFDPGSTENVLKNNLIGKTAAPDVPKQIGVLLAGSRNTVALNTIGGNRDGIRLERGETDPALQENRVTGNLIGVDGNGSQIPNETGIYLTNGARRNYVFDKNIVSGNTGAGIRLGAAGLTDALVVDNYVSGNYIGVNAAGDAAVPNGDGLVLGAGAQNNFIGAGVPGETLLGGNIVSGNSRNGILIARQADEQSAEVPKGNQIVKNLIGLSTAGDQLVPVPNRNGIFISNGAFQNTIGGLLDYNTLNPDGNTIGGNDQYGILVCPGSGDFEDCGPSSEAPHGNTIVGNFVGLSKFILTVSRPEFKNGSHGIYVLDSPDNRIGLPPGNLTASGNVIAQNGGDGVRIEGTVVNGQPSLATDNSVRNNYLGLAPGTSAGGLGNHGNGLTVIHTIQTEVRGNTFSGSGRYDSYYSDLPGPNFGVRRPEGDPLMATVAGNLFGVADDGAGGHVAVPGGALGGIKVDGVYNMVIGGVDQPDADRNVIGGAGGPGIVIAGGGAVSVQVKNNLIGTDADGRDFGNAGPGILIADGASFNLVGGFETGAGNTIAFNGGAGVRIDETAGIGNNVDPNSISGNAGVGIDLGPAGHTPNDPDDADTGANNLQNYPEITNRQIVGGELFVSFRVDSSPVNSNYGDNGLYVEFFEADASGEGARFLGSTYYTVADHDGSLAGVKTVDLGDAAALGITNADPVTATATDAIGNTSEFFPPFVPTAAAVTVAGRVATAAGEGLSRVAVTLTDELGAVRRTTTNSFGYYRFDAVAAGQTYVVGAASRKYSFTTPAQVVRIDEARDDLDFTAAP